jgi:hypothetical protein
MLEQTYKNAWCGFDSRPQLLSVELSETIGLVEGKHSASAFSGGSPDKLVVLKVNHFRRVLIRQAEQIFGLSPP